MSTRRNLLSKIGLSTAALVLVSGFGVAEEKIGLLKRPDLDSPWWLFEPFEKGSFLANGWFLSDLSPIERGAAVLTLAHKEGKTARVHICGHEGIPKGITSTKYLDLLLMDGGNGSTPSNEELGCVILSLAKHIRKTEEILEHSSILARFELHEDRLLRYKNTGLT